MTSDPAHRVVARVTRFGRCVLQLRAVLHQLLQREAAAALHRAHAQVGAGGVRGRGHHGEWRLTDPGSCVAVQDPGLSFDCFAVVVRELLVGLCL